MSDNGAYEQLVAAGMAAKEHADTMRWELGALAAHVVTEYGQRTFAQYATDIGEERKTLYTYRHVHRLFGEKFSTWGQFRERYPNLSWSHARDALRLKDVDAACAWLEEASAHGWSVEAARVELAKRCGQPVPPRPLLQWTGALRDGWSEVAALMNAASDAPAWAVEIIVRRIE